MHTSSGLGPRTFRTRAAEIGDRSVWTDTPSDKARKAQVEFQEFLSWILSRLSSGVGACNSPGS